MDFKKKIGMLLGIFGFLLWCGTVFFDAPFYASKLAFFIKMVKSGSLSVYALPLTFLIYSAASLVGRRISMIALSILALAVCGSYIYAGAHSASTIALTVCSAMLLSYSIASGKGSRI